MTRSLLGLTRFDEVRTVVEIGPGTGPFTRGILERISPDARVVSIERDPVLAKHLRARFDDPRLTVITGDARDMQRHLAAEGLPSKVDVVVSGVPFTTLKAEARDAILEAVRDSLADDGVFLLIQYSRILDATLHRYFPRIESRWVLRNAPPALAIACRLG